MSIYARGMARSFQAGRAQVRKLNADRRRFEFMEKLFDAWHEGKIIPAEIEADFIQRIIAETDANVPKLFSGDANICHSLRRKYEGRLA